MEVRIIKGEVCVEDNCDNMVCCCQCHPIWGIKCTAPHLIKNKSVRYRTYLNALLPKNPVTVELGVAEGFFTHDILYNWGPSLHYAVDNYGPIGVSGDGAYDQEWHNKNYHAMLDRIKAFKSSCKVLRGPTWAMAQHVPNNSCDLVYVDADHSYEGVKRDIEAWWPKLKVNGVMAFHDYENTDYGVKPAVTEFATANGLTINLIPENKTEDAGAWILKTK